MEEMGGQTNELQRCKTSRKFLLKRDRILPGGTYGKSPLWNHQAVGRGLSHCLSVTAHLQTSALIATGWTLDPWRDGSRLTNWLKERRESGLSRLTEGGKIPESRELIVSWKSELEEISEIMSIPWLSRGRDSGPERCGRSFKGPTGNFCPWLPTQLPFKFTRSPPQSLCLSYSQGWMAIHSTPKHQRSQSTEGKTLPRNSVLSGWASASSWPVQDGVISEGSCRLRWEKTNEQSLGLRARRPHTLLASAIYFILNTSVSFNRTHFLHP